MHHSVALSFRADLDPVCTRENGTVPFGTVRFGTVRFGTVPYFKCKRERFQMVPEVIKMEEEGAINHKNPIFFVIWRVSMFLCYSKWNRSFSGPQKRIRIAFPNVTVSRVLV